jgi:heme-degrading monooxygenase HmoA
MYARVVCGHVAPGQIDGVIHLWQTTVLPSVWQQHGFKGVRFLVERSTGKIMTMGLWETEADFRATITWNQGQIEKFTTFFLDSPTVEGYEVAVDV